MESGLLQGGFWDRCSSGNLGPVTRLFGLSTPGTVQLGRLGTWDKLRVPGLEVGQVTVARFVSRLK